jgi:hypothetical protein
MCKKSACIVFRENPHSHSACTVKLRQFPGIVSGPRDFSGGQSIFSAFSLIS